MRAFNACTLHYDVAIKKEVDTGSDGSVCARGYVIVLKTNKEIKPYWFAACIFRTYNKHRAFYLSPSSGEKTHVLISSRIYTMVFDLTSFV